MLHGLWWSVGGGGAARTSMLDGAEIYALYLLFLNSARAFSCVVCACLYSMHVFIRFLCIFFSPFAHKSVVVSCRVVLARSARSDGWKFIECEQLQNLHFLLIRYEESEPTP